MAKLKAIFDRFDLSGEGTLRGSEVEQALLYMERPIDSVQVNAWLTRLKDSEATVDFPEFVSQYSVSRAAPLILR